MSEKCIKMKSLYRHNRSGDIFAIESNEARQVISTSGPLFGDGFDPRVLDYDEHWNSEIAAKLDDFEQITKSDYLELLRQNGFIVDLSQRCLFYFKKYENVIIAYISMLSLKGI